MKKGLIIAATALITIGLALFTWALVAADFDFSKFDNNKYETHEYSFIESFADIEITSKETDIILKPSEDDKCGVVCFERETVKHNVTVENGTLKITVCDSRKWYDHITFLKKSLSVTVYLPSIDYETLKIESHTGDVTIENLSFGNADISTSTGRITVKTTTCKNFSAKGNTGDVILDNVIAYESFDIERSTGDVTFKSCDAENITVKTSTGDVKGTLRTAKIFIAKTSTGSVSVPDTQTGGKCEITTSTGDIDIKIS